MTTPLIPIYNNYLKTGPTVTYIGRNATSGDGFPAGAQTFTAGTKLIVVCCEPAGSPAASGVTVGGVAMTQAAQTGVVNLRSASVWYLETSASGSLTISGSGGSGRSALDVYEVRNYSSSTPIYTGTLVNAADTSSLAISVQAPTNSIALGAGTHGFTNPTVSASQGPAPVVVTAAYESATGHYSWYQRPTGRGTTTYTVVGSVVSGIDLAIAVWK